MLHIIKEKKEGGGGGEEKLKRDLKDMTAVLSSLCDCAAPSSPGDLGYEFAVQWWRSEGCTGW